MTLLDVLEFYADQGNWKKIQVGTSKTSGSQLLMSLIEKDHGQKAKQMLEAYVKWLLLNQ